MVQTVPTLQGITGNSNEFNEKRIEENTTVNLLRELGLYLVLRGSIVQLVELRRTLNGTIDAGSGTEHKRVLYTISLDVLKVFLKLCVEFLVASGTWI